MNLSEIRQLFVEQTGYTGLVTDAIGGDYSDKAGLLCNGSYFLNAGMRWLDRRWPGQGNERRYSATLTEDAYTLDVPYIQYVRRLDVSDGTTITHPRMISYNEMRSLYTEPYANVSSGLPKYWTWNPRPHAALTGQLVNGSFSLGLEGWTTYTGTPSVSGGVLSLSGNGASANDAIYQRLASPIDGSLDISVVVDSVDPGAILYVTVGLWVTSPSDVAVVSTTGYTTTGIKTITPGSDWDIIVVFIADDVDNTATVSSIVVDSANAEAELASYSKQILFMPPASQDYSVEIWGEFKNIPLNAEGSYNWWTVEHPDLVIEAARAIYERQGHRNVSGAKVFEEHCQEELDRLYSEYRFSLYSGMAPEDLALNG